MSSYLSSVLCFVVVVVNGYVNRVYFHCPSLFPSRAHSSTDTHIVLGILI